MLPPLAKVFSLGNVCHQVAGHTQLHHSLTSETTILGAKVSIYSRSPLKHTALLGSAQITQPTGNCLTSSASRPCSAKPEMFMENHGLSSPVQVWTLEPPSCKGIACFSAYNFSIDHRFYVDINSHLISSLIEFNRNESSSLILRESCIRQGQTDPGANLKAMRTKQL